MYTCVRVFACVYARARACARVHTYYKKFNLNAAYVHILYNVTTSKMHACKFL
jgi:hypothetical protein